MHQSFPSAGDLVEIAARYRSGGPTSRRYLTKNTRRSEAVRAPQQKRNVLTEWAFRIFRPAFNEINRDRRPKATRLVGTASRGVARFKRCTLLPPSSLIDCGPVPERDETKKQNERGDEKKYVHPVCRVSDAGETSRSALTTSTALYRKNEGIRSRSLDCHFSVAPPIASIRLTLRANNPRSTSPSPPGAARTQEPERRRGSEAKSCDDSVERFCNLYSILSL